MSAEAWIERAKVHIGNIKLHGLDNGLEESLFR